MPLPPVETLALIGVAGGAAVAISTIALRMIKKGGVKEGRSEAERGWLVRAVKLEWLIKKRHDRKLIKLADQLAELERLRDRSD